MSAFDKVMEERKKLVEQIIANMRQGYVMPKEKWDRSMSMHIVNPVSHARYRGINFVRLYLSMIENGYQDGRWMTYKQAESQGWQVRKGEHGVRLEKYIFERTFEEENPDTGEIEKVTKRLDTPMVNQFVVFNGSQIDGIPKLEELPPLEHDEILQIAEDVIASSDCPIVETMEGRAYYSPLLDEIHLPVRDLFLDQKSFLATTMHEMVHSTGHSSRLNRDLSGFFRSESYAREELRAELGAFFLEHDLGIQLEGQHFNSHTHYLQSWISVLKDDPNELFRAITDSQKAATYITDRYQLYIEQKKVVRDEQLLNKSIIVTDYDENKWKKNLIRYNAGMSEKDFESVEQYNEYRQINRENFARNRTMIKEIVQNHIDGTKHAFKNNQDFTLWLKENGIKEVSVKGMDLVAATDFKKAYETMLMKLPGTKGRLESIELISNKTAGVRQDTSNWVYEKRVLRLSKAKYSKGNYFEVLEDNLMGYTTSFRPRDTDAFTGSFQHEFGHLIEGWISKEIGRENLQKELFEIFGQNLTYISGYGEVSYDEWFAEMTSAFLSGSQKSDIIKFGCVVEKYLGESLDKNKECINSKKTINSESIPLYFQNKLKHDYPSQMRQDEAAAIRIALKLENKKPGHGDNYLLNWLNVQHKKYPNVPPERDQELINSFFLSKSISLAQMLDPVYEASRDYPDAKNTIEAVFGHDGSGFKYDVTLKDRKQAPVMRCAM